MRLIVTDVWVSEPNPAWFYLQIAQGGNLNFFISQVSNSGNPIDVDFIAWGPFNGPPPIFGPAFLNDGTEIGCSFSAAATESFSITNAQQGQYYVILLTNFSNQPGQISLTQTNVDQPGAGATDCDIVCPLSLGGDFVLCPGLTSPITATIDDAASYEWFLNGVLIPGESGQSYTVTGPGTYSVVVNKPGCVEDATDEVVVSAPDPLPLNDPQDLVICAVGPGPYTFNLNDVINADFLNGTSIFDYDTFYFFHNAADAESGLNSIPAATADNYPGTDGETIYIRATDYNTGCFQVYSFQLILNAGPTANTPEDMTNCDIDGDGLAEFDLTTQDAVVMGAQDPTEFTITYHITDADAAGNTNAIGNPETFNGTDGQVIYVRITNVDDEDCYGQTSFTLIVTPKPDINVPAPLVICDDNNDDGTATFDLTTTLDEVANDEPGMDLNITVHASLADANAGTGALTVPNLVTTQVQSQTVYIRVIENGAGNPDCFTVVELSLTVNPLPEVIQAIDYILCDDNGAGDGVEVFDLTTKTDEITGGNATYIVSYYESQADAEGALNPIAAPGTYTNTTPWTQEIFVRAETAEGCVETTSFTLVVNPLPAIVTPVEDTECESAVGSGEATFDLASQDAIITGNNADYIVEYYNSQAAAQAPDPAGLVDTAPYTTGTTTLYVRVTDSNTNCVSYGELNLEVVPVPVPGVATPLEVCEDDPAPVNIYIGTFDLTPAINEIVGAQSGLTVTVHHNLADAENNENAVGNTTAYNNIHAPGATPANPADGTQVVYVRLQQTGTECYAIGMIDIIVHPIPAIGELEPYELCDNNNSPDGIEVFDLTSMNDDVTNGVAGLTVTYYETQADAEGNTNPIPTPEAYENTLDPHQRTIYVRLDSAFGCYSTGSFQIIVNPLPVIEANLEPFAACEENPGEALFNLPEVDPLVTMGADGYNVVYYETQTEAETGIGTPITSPYLSVAKTIYVRVIDEQTGCASATDLELEVLPAPIVATPAPLEECDDNNDDVEIFDMTPVINDIINALGSVAVTIHETMEDATYDANPILNTAAYTNVEAETTGGVQVVYVRVESNTTECFDIVPLQLIVRPRPEATEPTDYHMCDNDTNDTDGIAVFNLTTKTAEILDTLDPAQFTVEYYDLESDANAGISPITNPVTYASATNTLYVRVENNATECYDIVTLELIVNPLPQATQPTPYTLCDENIPGDETEEFDLTTKIAEIIGTQEGLIVTFHQTMADAQAGINAEGTPEAYLNNETVETLFVRVEVEATGCYRVVLLDVRVEPLPLLADNVEDLVVCDPDTNGIATFNLDELAEALLNDGLNIDLEFYETFQNATDGLFPIPNTDQYTNEVPFEQPLYVVATNTLTGCQSNVLPITIYITPSPVDPNVLEDLEDLALCDEDDSNNQDAIATFDLTQQDQVIIDAINIPAEDLTIHYFTTVENAENGAPRITDDENFRGSDEQWIFVRVEGNVSGCYSILSFQLQVDTPLQLVTPPMYTLCNTALPNLPATEVFDLTTMDNTILGPAGVGQGHTVEYYLTQADALADTNAIANPEAFVNTTPGTQTLYVAVTTNPGGCRSYTTLTLKVLPLPTPDTTPTALELCDDNNSPDGLESFNLTLAEADIRDNDNSTTITYHLTQEDADADANAIADPANHVSGTATIYVRVEANTNNPLDPKCYQVVELGLIVNPLPALGDAGVIDPYSICEAAPSDGFAVFNLADHNSTVISGGDVTGYTFKYFRNLADAQANFNAIPLANYTNETPTQQAVWVRVENTTTGCISYGTFDLLVEEEAIANAVAGPIRLCDDQDGVNDGVANYDLTQLDATVLGGQDPAQFIVQYFTEDPELNGNQNPIADPANFRNEGHPGGQTIWIRVYNNATIGLCSDYTTVDIIVEERPEPVIQGGTICVDFMTGEVLRTHTLDTGLDTTHSFQWFFNGTQIPGATGPSYEASEEGTYYVIAATANGCTSLPSAPVTIDLSGPPTAIGTGYSVSNYFSDNQVITINVDGFGEYEYRLDEGPWQESNIFTNVSAGEHTVYVRDMSTDSPCSEFVLALEGIMTVDYPRYFTPNGDGYHDRWNIKGLGDDNTDAKIYIFDRYGKLVKQISSQGDGWDGTMNGTPMPGTDYWFTVQYRETVNGVSTVKEFKAHFSLKR
jgi:gliding motility-associated-like protein